MAAQPIESGLRFILKSLCNGASERPGCVGRITLEHGLEVAILVKQGRMWLQLGRVDSWPGEKEAETVIGHMPFKVLVDVPERFERGRCYYVRFSWQWPIPKEEQGVLL